MHKQLQTSVLAHIDGLVQDCSISIANTLEILHFALSHIYIIDGYVVLAKHISLYQ